MKYVESGTDYNHSVAYTYDTINNLTAQVETINGVETTTGYTYDKDNRVTAVEAGGTKKLYTYDGLGRVITETVKQGDTTILTTTYTYENPTTDTTSGRVATKQIEAIGNYDFSYTYAYDDNGNIVSVREDDDITTYTYDAQNQLIRENDGVTNCTYTWEYDNAGNIQNRKEYAYTTTEDIANQTPVYTTDYTYDTQWKDLLVEYDDCEITYDEIGNPTSFMGKTYTWQHGRQLASLSYGSNNWVYTYNADGMRTSRVNGDTAYTYVYNGGQLVKMTMNNDVLTFTYDANGAPLTVTWNGTTYYYVTNLQGDVVAILDSTGNCMASYTYNAWGQTSMEITELEELNPLRYRGYVYDTEYGYYYLQSRYYDPEIGRFINADKSIYHNLLGYGLFTYCTNNPVNLYDPIGENPASMFLSWLSCGWTAAVAEPTWVGELVYIGGLVVLGIGALIYTHQKTDSDIGKHTNTEPKVETETPAEAEKAPKPESPKKDKDWRFKGNPGDVNEDGDKQTLIGQDGKAVKERHLTDHGKPKYHTNPHDHDIWWEDGEVHFGPPQNYWNGEVPIFP